VKPAPQHFADAATDAGAPSFALLQRVGVNANPPTAARHSPLALWHLLSLDAPTVATLWTYFIARTAGIHLRWQSPAAMFVAVWMLYAADRLLDARTDQDLEERHRFHYRHRKTFLTAIAAAAPVLALLLHQLPTATLHLYTLLATLVGTWLLIIHIQPTIPKDRHPEAVLSEVEWTKDLRILSAEATIQRNNARLPKELAVGLCFPAAVFIPTVAAAPQLRLALLAPAFCFAAVCTLNCLFVYAWEHPAPRNKAHATTRWGTNHLVALSLFAIAFAIGTLWVPHISLLRCGFSQLHCTIGLTTTKIPIACALSTLTLLALHHQRKHITPTNLRALVDAALLTPLLFLAR